MQKFPSSTKFSLISIILLISVGCDQSSKYTAKFWLEGQPTRSHAGDLVRLAYHENSGAFMSLGANLPPTLRTLFFTLLVAIILTVLFLFILRTDQFTPFGLLCATLVLGGGIGNLIDRFVNNGAVIDFLNVGIGSTFRTGIFNVADTAVFAGAIAMLVLSRLAFQDGPTNNSSINDNTPVLSEENA